MSVYENELLAEYKRISKPRIPKEEIALIAFAERMNLTIRQAVEYEAARLEVPVNENRVRYVAQLQAEIQALLAKEAE